MRLPRSNTTSGMPACTADRSTSPPRRGRCASRPAAGRGRRNRNEGRPRSGRGGNRRRPPAGAGCADGSGGPRAVGRHVGALVGAARLRPLRRAEDPAAEPPRRLPGDVPAGTIHRLVEGVDLGERAAITAAPTRRMRQPRASPCASPRPFPERSSRLSFAVGGRWIGAKRRGRMGHAESVFGESPKRAAVGVPETYRPSPFPLRGTRVPRAPSVSASPSHLPLQGRKKAPASSRLPFFPTRGEGRPAPTR